MEYNIPQSAYTDVYYVGIALSSDSCEFKMTKPLKATSYDERVYWINEVGGLQYFDFTSHKEESDAISTQYYEKNYYDYYTRDAVEKRMPYDISVTKTVTLTSHLIEEEAANVINSLAKSPYVWVMKDGVKHYINLTEAVREERDNHDGLFIIRIKYQYSELD